MDAASTAAPWRAVLVLTVVVTVAITGCGGSRDAAPKVGKTADSVWGRTFVVVSATVGGATKQLVPGSKVQLTFERGELRAHTGCNQIFGRASTDGDRLVVSDIGGTLMACEKRLADQETWLRTLLERGPRWRLNRDDLVLKVADTELRLVDVRAAEPN